MSRVLGRQHGGAGEGGGHRDGGGLRGPAHEAGDVAVRTTAPRLILDTVCITIAFTCDHNVVKLRVLVRHICWYRFLSGRLRFQQQVLYGVTKERAFY